MTGAVARIQRWAMGLRAETVALYLAVRDPRTPLAARALAVLVVAYALSPIDLIPDFIPVLGLLDDLLLLPLGIAIVRRMIPAPLMAEFRRAARDLDRPRPSLWGAAAVGAIWLGVVLAVLWWLAPAVL